VSSGVGYAAGAALRRGAGGEVGATVRAVDVGGADVRARHASRTGAGVGGEIDVVRLAAGAGHCVGAEVRLGDAAALVDCFRFV